LARGCRAFGIERGLPWVSLKQTLVLSGIRQQYPIVYLPLALGLALNPCVPGGRAVGLTRWWQIMWFRADDCGLVAPNLVSVATNVVSTPRIESLNVVEKSAMIAVQPSDDCSSLHLAMHNDTGWPVFSSIFDNICNVIMLHMLLN
jgi:hypothetical protein